MRIERYRGFEIERHHTGPWDVTYQWSREGWDCGDPIGYEQSIADCRRSIDDLLEVYCTACRDTGLVRVDPFEPETAPCPDCKVSTKEEMTQ